jgi:hypothetical protein
MFWFPGLGLAPVFGLNALIVVLVLFGLIQRIAADGSPSDVGFSRWYALLCLFAIAISAFRGTGSPNTDYPSDTPHLRVLPRFRLCELWAFDRDNNLPALQCTWRFDLSFPWHRHCCHSALALLPLIFFVIAVGKLPRIPITASLAFGIGLGVLWMLRNIGLSGCAVSAT